ncbi:MAG: outer membrane protein assembly factor BamE domain-containing protein [Alphaproteobacteria bacterium]
MNKLKKIQILMAFLVLSLLVTSCAKQYYYAGISENTAEEIVSNYPSNNYSKELILNLLGAPLIKENNGDLWIYISSKDYGNETFRKSVYKKTLKLYFSNNILLDIKELSL